VTTAAFQLSRSWTNHLSASSRFRDCYLLFRATGVPSPGFRGLIAKAAQRHRQRIRCEFAGFQEPAELSSNLRYWIGALDGRDDGGVSPADGGTLGTEHGDYVRTHSLVFCFDLFFCFDVRPGGGSSSFVGCELDSLFDILDEPFSLLASLPHYAQRIHWQISDLGVDRLDPLLIHLHLERVGGCRGAGKQQACSYRIHHVQIS
jgi:hypothetical protein